MSFDNKQTYELIDIAKAGLGFSLNAESKPVVELIQIAAAAKQSGAVINVANKSVLADEDIQLIKNAGSDHIKFD
jgi:hypothetical protein